MEFDRLKSAPAVLGEEPPVVDLTGKVLLPGVVVNPSRNEVRVETRNVGDQVILLAYSSQSALVEGCGTTQPWVAVPADQVERLAVDANADVILWDMALPGHVRHVDGDE
jgi:hypothetical protein